MALYPYPYGDVAEMAREKVLRSSENIVELQHDGKRPLPLQETLRELRIHTKLIGIHVVVITAAGS